MIPCPKGKTVRSWSVPKRRAQETNGDLQFIEPLRNPTAKEVRILISLIIANETTMENHFYSIGGDIQLQTEGGAIGSDTT